MIPEFFFFYLVVGVSNKMPNVVKIQEDFGDEVIKIFIAKLVDPVSVALTGDNDFKYNLNNC